jgi:hypothetical protein
VSVSRLVPVVSICVLAACGGGGDDASPSDSLFFDYFSYYAGGSREIRAGGVNSGTLVHQHCDYRPSISSEAAARQVQSWGGRVTVETEHQWCAVVGGDTLCLTRLGANAFAYDEAAAAPSSRAAEMVIGLEDGRHVSFASTWSPGLAGPSAFNSFSASIPDSAIPASGVCSNGASPPRLASDIDGAWAGKRVVYDAANRTGYQEAHTMVCSAQACNIQTRVFADLTFSVFSEPGGWRTDSASIQGGAVMSRDGEALALWFCPGSVIEPGVTQFDVACELYGFDRMP